LLYALVVSELLELREGLFANGAETAAFLVKGPPGYLGGIHELLSQLWHADLATAASIRSGRPAALHDFTASSDEDMAAMLRGMHPSAVAAAGELMQRFDFAAYRSIIDVGGGTGGLAAALCAAHPQLHGTLFELPRIAALAAPILQASTGGARVAIETGDILRERPRRSFDAAVMRALLQVLAPDDACRAIMNTAAVLRTGGHFYVLGGGILADDRLGPRSAVFLNLTLMNLYPGGASYTEAEHARWLVASGCGELQRITLASGGGIIRATKLQ
jgi:SAM-dependent methyltransferase